MVSETTLYWMAAVVSALFGLVFGSFANVVIWRMPREESVVTPPSKCPACGHTIAWYDNVPLLSWAWLRGRCRDCSAPISGRYPLVEGLSGALWLAAALRFGASWSALFAIALFYVLLVLSFIDIDTGRLPNRLVAILAGTGAAGAALGQVTGIRLVPLVGMARDGLLTSAALTALIGAALGAGVSGAVAAAYGAARGRAGLGPGDVKLLGAMGLFLGPYVLMALVIGSLAGAVTGIVQVRRTGGDVASFKMPFGPFLAGGGVVAALFGPQVWTWYLGLFGL